MTSALTLWIVGAGSFTAGMLLCAVITSAHRPAPRDAVSKGEAYKTDDWSFPGHGIRIVEVSPVTADSIDAAVRGD